MKNKTALILEGGGSRGMFTAGILESFLENGINFDTVFGVSAGALYGASFVSKQRGRNLKLNQYLGDKRYGGLKHLWKTGNYFSWDFIFGELAHEILPYDYKTLRTSTDFYVGVSNCNTGKAEFFRTNHLEKTDIVEIFKATGSLPFVSRIVEYKGAEYLDGGLTNSIPYDIAMQQGADKIVVILTRPMEFVKLEMKFPQLCKWYYRKHPMICENLKNRPQRYNESRQRLKALEKEGRAFVICPKEELTVGRVERNPNKTAAIYHEAMNYGKEIMPALKKWMSKSLN